MVSEFPNQGSLFASDFLTDAITDVSEWKAFEDSVLSDIEERLSGIFRAFPTDQSPNEAHTEDDLIWPILGILGWGQYLRQQNLSMKGRDDVPDGLLFEDIEAKKKATSFPDEWRRYGFGTAVVESKRWLRPLDRRGGRRGEETAPSTQMLRYLRRIDDITEGGLRWGILTNGARWRLYYQGAQSVSEQFFELNLATILNLPGHNEGLFALDEDDRRHWLKAFILIFQRDAFVPAGADPRTFHQRAIEEGRVFEERVAEDLSNTVFNDVFPELVRSIAHAAPEAELQEAKEGALILLYRLLFILFAEDRNLLPIKDKRYDDYGLRKRVRLNVGERKDKKDVFSQTAARYWDAISDLSNAIDLGDASIGLPPYNGGLFEREATPILSKVRLPDSVMANVIDAMSFEQKPDGRKYISYRNLSVQQLGSIYERLLEYDAVRKGDNIEIQLNPFARKGSGSYYTPDDLVRLILHETLVPLVGEKTKAFTDKLEELRASRDPDDRKLGQLKRLDPAQRILGLKICDPAMGSGHFLVGLVDFLSDQIIACMADAEAQVPKEWGDYISPLSERIDTIRHTILDNAEERDWTIDEEQLDDRHIIRRMVLKRCVYGVDKNPMAVELAKVSLWLHTFTVGAPLSFLDHHLRCGDSLFGSNVHRGLEKARRAGGELLLGQPLNRAVTAATSMDQIERMTDSEIAEAHRSAGIFHEVQSMTGPLDRFLSLLYAFEWLEVDGADDKAAIQSYLSGGLGDPFEIAEGKARPDTSKENGKKFVEILRAAQKIATEERFFNWQVGFPGVWRNWDANGYQGGFDAVIGNPPWDRLRIEAIEWFIARSPDIAKIQKASDRKKAVKKLQESNPSLALAFDEADKRAASAARNARGSGEYPLLSKGELNIYSLFVERAQSLIAPNGIVGLLTPSGIAADKNAANFFKSISTGSRLRALADFENKRPGLPPFFPSVHAQAKFVAIIFGGKERAFPKSKCAFFLSSIDEWNDEKKYFYLSAEDFDRVNPNTGTAPIFRYAKDAELTTTAYKNHPVLVRIQNGEELKSWPVKYSRVFDMSLDSEKFRTRAELEEGEQAYPTKSGWLKSVDEDWAPLYEGKMIWHFDHRAASIRINPDNPFRPAYPEETTLAQHQDPNYFPEPQYWIGASDYPEHNQYVLAFRDVTNPTDRRTMDAAIIPHRYAGNTLPVLIHAEENAECYALLAANFNAIVFDYIVRQKVQKNHLNKYIVEQLPVVSREAYDEVKFGQTSAREVVGHAVLELSYISHDMAAFAKDMGFVDRKKAVKEPFPWDEERRKSLTAKLDAVFFHLYGITDRNDVRYIFSTFSILERDDRARYDGKYRSCDLCLAYLNALAAGDPDAEVDI